MTFSQLLSDADYAYMEELHVETMFHVCQRFAYSSTVDSIGQPTDIFTGAEEFPCGYEKLRYGESENIGGTVSRLDGILRIPNANVSQIGERDRLRVKWRDKTDYDDFEVVGRVIPGAVSSTFWVRLIDAA